MHAVLGGFMPGLYADIGAMVHTPNYPGGYAAIVVCMVGGYADNVLLNVKARV